MTFQQSFNSLITKIQTNFTWLNTNKANAVHTHSQYLTSHQDISGKENTSNKVTSLSAQSTDSQYPSAKCVYDAIQASSGGGGITVAMLSGN